MHTRELGISRYRKALADLRKIQEQFTTFRLMTKLFPEDPDENLEKALPGYLKAIAVIEGMEHVLCLSRRQVEQYREAAKLFPDKLYWPRGPSRRPRGSSAMF